MSSTKVPTLNGLLMLYVGLIAVSLSGFLFTSLEILFLRSAAIIFTLAHLHYGICVVIKDNYAFSNNKKNFRFANSVTISTFNHSHWAIFKNGKNELKHLEQCTNIYYLLCHFWYVFIYPMFIIHLMIHISYCKSTPFFCIFVFQIFIFVNKRKQNLIL